MMRALRLVLGWIGILAVPSGFLTGIVCLVAGWMPIGLGVSFGVAGVGLVLLWIASAIKFDDDQATWLGRLLRSIDGQINKHDPEFYRDHGA